MIKGSYYSPSLSFSLRDNRISNTHSPEFYPSSVLNQLLLLMHLAHGSLWPAGLTVYSFSPSSHHRLLSVLVPLSKYEGGKLQENIESESDWSDSSLQDKLYNLLTNQRTGRYWIRYSLLTQLSGPIKYQDTRVCRVVFMGSG